MTKILIIDDKKDNLTAVKALLKHLEPDYEVLTAESGSAGIKLAKSKHPDTILLDIHMPKMDGYEVCRRLRADKKTELIPIIFLTAVKTSFKDRIRGLELGGDAYLTKPIDEGELLAVLHAMLRIKRAEDERLHQYKNIVSSSTDMLALIDKNFTYLAVNQAYLDAFKKKSDEVVGHKIYEIVGEEYFKTIIKANAIRCLAGDTINFQNWFDFPGFEKSRYLDINYSPYFGKNNKIEGYVVNARNITERKRAEEALHNIAVNFSTVQGENFFNRVSEYLTEKLNIDYAFVGDILEEDKIKVVGGFGKGDILESFEYDLKDTPCENVVGQSLCCYTADVQKLFPKDYLLKEMNIDGYLGIPLFDSAGQATGLLVLLNERPITNQNIAESVSQIFSERISAEIQRLRANEKLIESEEQYRILTEASQDVIFIIDRHDKILFVNTFGANLFGKIPQDVIGKQRNKLFPLDVSEKQYQSIQQVFKSGRSLQIESKVMFRKHAVWLNTQLVPIKNEAGEIHTVLGVSRNITESKLVEEKLKGSAALLKESQKVANLGSYLLDISGGTWKSSDILDEVFGIDQDYKRDINGWVKIIHPDERKEMLDYFTTHILAEGRLFDKEYRIIRKNDQKEHWVHGLGKLEFDADGNPVKMIGTIQDITERKQAEQELIKLSQSVEQSPVSVMITNLKGELEYVNPKFEQLTGYSNDEIRGQNPRFLNSGVQSKDFYTELWQTLVSGKVWRGEFCNRKKNGDQYWEQASISPIIDKNNSITHYVAVKEDITSRKKVREEIERLKDFNESILNGMAEGVVVMDPEGIIEYVNAAVEPLLGYSEEELLHRHQSLIVPQDQQSIVQAEDKLRIRDERSTYDLKLKRKNGQMINVKVSGSPRFKDGEYVGTMAVFTDITEQKIAQEKLKKAREYTQNLIDTSMDMIVSVDLGRRIHEFNPAAEKAFGYKKEEIFGKHVNILYADNNAGRKVADKTIAEGSHVTEIWNKRKNGDIFPSLLEASVLKDSEGIPMGIMGVSRDISKEKAAKKALRESEDRYRELINIAPLGIAIHQDGKWVMLNNFAVKILGYENEQELLGQPALDIIHPDYRALFTDRVAEMIRTGKSIAAAEQKVLKKDGSEMDAMATSAPINFQGRPAFEVAVMNITELRRAQKAVKESEEKFRSVIEQSNDGIYVLQKDRFVFTNPRFAKLTGYKMDELRGDGFSFKSLFTDKGWAIVEERNVRRNRGEKLLGRFIFEGVRKNGRKRDWESSVTEIDWEGKKATLGILQDVTERIKARDKLEAALEKARDAEKVKTLFLTNMSHEIRTPLNSIMGFTGLIEQSFKNKSGLEELEFFENVQESSKRLMHTVHEVLDMSQIESETLPVNLKKYDLGMLLEKALKPLLPQVKAKGLELNVKTAQNAFIRADENCVVQSIINLVDNAIKYTEKGRIDINIKEKTHTLELKIKDTGIGIGKEYIKDIFQVFTQESTGYTKKYQGVGLGLALVKNYLELCDADIAVKSKKGVGSTFTITFKKMKLGSKVKKEIRPGKKIKVSAAVSKPQVLVVEDDLSSQRLISFFLRDYFDLKFAESVFEAKEKLESNPIEMVLLDLSLLGNEDGLDLARFMRKSKKWQKTPIIAATAHAFTEDREKCFKAGCNDYIAKPIIREKLIEKMKAKLKVTN